MVPRASSMRDAHASAAARCSSTPAAPLSSTSGSRSQATSDAVRSASVAVMPAGYAGTLHRPQPPGGQDADMRRLAAGLLATVLLTAACSSGDGSSSGSAPTPRPSRYYDAPVDRGYDVVHYDIHLRYRARSGRIDGGTTITATATRRLTLMTLDLHGLALGPTRFEQGSGKAAEPAGRRRDGDHLTLTLPHAVPRGRTFAVSIAYHG